MARIARSSSSAARSTLQINGRKFAALLAHAASYYTTYLFIASLAGSGLSSLAIALAIEIFLHIGKSILLKQSHRDIVGLACFAIDTFFNAGGLYPAVQKINTTGSWAMAAAATATKATIEPVTAAIIAIALGALLSVAPILLWKDD